MTDLIKRALTKTIHRKGPRGKEQVIVVQPNDKIVLLVDFAIVMALCLSGLEIVHLISLHAFNSEIFSAITGLIGTITGVLIAHQT